MSLRMAVETAACILKEIKGKIFYQARGEGKFVPLLGTPSPPRR
jgi:hypothetical protein